MSRARSGDATSARAWIALAGALAAVALIGFALVGFAPVGLAQAGFALPSTSLDWQPALALPQPWRAWSAVGVHYSPLHLGANLAGVAAVGLLGWTAGAPGRWAAAWFVAWPLTQLGLLCTPALAHYGGLSGVLHAGVAVVAVGLLIRRGPAALPRWVGGALCAGLLVKLVHEAAWQAPLLRHPVGWDIAVAPVAHLSGAAAGLLAALVAAVWTPGRAPTR